MSEGGFGSRCSNCWPMLALKERLVLLAGGLLLAGNLFSAAWGQSKQSPTVLAQAPPSLPSADSHIAPSTTILPTDVLPLPQVQNRLSFAENLQLRLLQKLPSNFYFSSSVESSFRIETNPFQFPIKRVFLQKLPPPPQFAQLPLPTQQQFIDVLRLVDSQDNIFRVLPNVTGGFTLTPRTRIFGNYFMIRDSLFKNIRLNTVIH